MDRILDRLARLERARDEACLANDAQRIVELEAELFAIRALLAR